MPDNRTDHTPPGGASPTTRRAPSSWLTKGRPATPRTSSIARCRARHNSGPARLMIYVETRNARRSPHHARYQGNPDNRTGDHRPGKPHAHQSRPAHRPTPARPTTTSTTGTSPDQPASITRDLTTGPYVGQPAYYTPAHLPGPFRTQRRARADQWVVSRSVVHPPLVSEQDFVAVQAVRAHPAPGDGRAYVLMGLLRCGWCGRRLESCWSHGRAAYRCQHGNTSAKRAAGRRRNLYLREDHLVEAIQALLVQNDAAISSRASGLAQLLRQRGLVVICSESDCTLEPQVPD